MALTEKDLEAIEDRVYRVNGQEIKYAPITTAIADFLVKTPQDVLDLVDEVRRLREREWKLRGMTQ